MGGEGVREGESVMWGEGEYNVGGEGVREG